MLFRSHLTRVNPDPTLRIGATKWCGDSIRMAQALHAGITLGARLAVIVRAFRVSQNLVDGTVLISMGEDAASIETDDAGGSDPIVPEGSTRTFSQEAVDRYHVAKPQNKRILRAVEKPAIAPRHYIHFTSCSSLSGGSKPAVQRVTRPVVNHGGRRPNSFSTADQTRSRTALISTVNTQPQPTMCRTSTHTFAPCPMLKPRDGTRR